MYIQLLHYLNTISISVVTELTLSLLKASKTLQDIELASTESIIVSVFKLYKCCCTLKYNILYISFVIMSFVLPLGIILFLLMKSNITLFFF